MIKILHVTECLATGVLQAIVDICHLLSDDFQFVILYSRRPETPADIPARFPSSVEFEIWDATRELHPFKDLDSYKTLKRVIAEYSPDIIHAHSSKAGGLVRISLPTRGYAVCYSPHGFSFARSDISAVTRLSYRMIEWVLGRTQAVTVAAGLDEYVLATRVSRHSVMIPNTFELVDLYSPMKNRSAERPLRVVGNGRISAQKNFSLFCRIARALQRESISFTWIGSGDAQLQEDLPDNLSVTGWLPRGDALKIMAQAHVFLQTSLWEGRPYSLLEALSLGLPILAMPSVGNKEFVIEAQNGYFRTTADSFYDIIQTLESDRLQIELLSTNSRKLAENQPTSTEISLRLRSLYDNFERYRKLG